MRMSDPEIRRIEANVVLIAACVPVLQPIVDIVRGRDTWKSVGGPPSTEHVKYNKRSGLSDGRSNDIKMVHKPQRRRDKYGFTIDDTTFSRVESESQHGINTTPTEDTTTPQEDGHGFGNTPEHRILRTDEVMLTFDGGENGPTSASKRWAPV